MHVAIDLDTALSGNNLPAFAFARRVAEAAGPEQAPAIIDGIRGFVEGKHAGLVTALSADLSTASDAFAATETLGAAAGLSDRQLQGAYRTAWLDMSAVPFVLEPAPGLLELLDTPAAHIFLVTRLEAGLVWPLLEAAGIAASADTAVTTEVAEHTAVAIASRWTSPHGLALRDAQRRGITTVLLDRHETGAGDPTWRTRTLADLTPDLLRLA